MIKLIEAPWTAEQIETLNRFLLFPENLLLQAPRWKTWLGARSLMPYLLMTAPRQCAQWPQKMKMVFLWSKQKKGFVLS